MPKSGSFLAVDVQNVIISAVTQSENGEDIIIRCIETSGQHTTATLDPRFANRKWTHNLKPCEIRTIRINQHKEDIKEVNLREE